MKVSEYYFILNKILIDYIMYRSNFFLLKYYFKEIKFSKFQYVFVFFIHFIRNLHLGMIHYKGIYTNIFFFIAFIFILHICLYTIYNFIFVYTNSYIYNLYI